MNEGVPPRLPGSKMARHRGFMAIGIGLTEAVGWTS